IKRVPMHIRILHLIEGAQNARGLTVVIDVFRAFSTACFLAANGASKILPVADLDVAYRMKESNPDFILIGERRGKILPGFDYGNSPTQVKDVDFSGKTVILTTSAGTQGIQNARNAEEIITGSFLNAGAVLAYIQKKQPEELSLVCMGHEAVRPTEEDTLLAEYIQSSLEGVPIDLRDAPERLRHTSGKRFFDPANHSSEPPSDFYLCLEKDRFPFILKVSPYPEGKESGLFQLKKFYPEVL
ncbi:MAG TPA: 2-phosphosulfolactate phosphatase, partial [Spirochaetales bacterium]|nr:2-phosphosulfolactate phosphatase [Spirochaetales bacterium]